LTYLYHFYRHRSKYVIDFLHIDSKGAQLGFEELLSRKLPQYNRNLIPRCRSRFGAQVLQALADQSSELAFSVYSQAELLPQTQTELMLCEQYGYVLNGNLYNSDNLVICYKDAAPHVLKCLEGKEANRIEAFQTEMLQCGSVSPPSLVKFDIYAHLSRKFMIMPLYASTIEPISKFSLDTGKRLCLQIMEALRFIHSRGFNHMDVKPSNICVRENGDFVLIDMGSIVRVNEYSESTVCFVPKDFQPREGRYASSSSRYVGEPGGKNDWWMLAMTIAQKVCSLEVGVCGSKTPPLMPELRMILGGIQVGQETLFSELLSMLC